MLSYSKCPPFLRALPLPCACACACPATGSAIAANIGVASAILALPVLRLTLVNVWWSVAPSPRSELQARLRPRLSQPSLAHYAVCRAVAGRFSSSQSIDSIQLAEPARCKSQSCLRVALPLLHVVDASAARSWSLEPVLVKFVFETLGYCLHSRGGSSTTRDLPHCSTTIIIVIVAAAGSRRLVDSKREPLDTLGVDFVPVCFAPSSASASARARASASAS